MHSAVEIVKQNILAAFCIPVSTLLFVMIISYNYAVLWRVPIIAELILNQKKTVCLKF